MAGKMIAFEANGRESTGYLARPEDAGNGKGLIVLQEWWGLVPHIQDVAARFARMGYVALAPDLWDGKQTTDPDEASRLFMALDIDRAEKQIRGAIATLRAEGATGKVGVMGFCLGGQLAMYTACANAEEIGACVNFYGIHPAVNPAWRSLTAPVLGIFGERDPHVPPRVAKELDAAITAAGGSFEHHIYPADHGFFNETRPEVYAQEQADDAWRRVLGFFAKNL